MKRSFVFIVKVALLTVVNSGWAKAEDSRRCMFDTSHPIEAIEGLKIAMLSGLYEDVADIIDVGNDWPAQERTRVVDSFSTISPSGADGCITLQRVDYSEALASELIMFRFTGGNVFAHVVAVFDGQDWIVARAQLDSDFADVFQYIK